jgi:hypothetical protein
LDSYKDIFIFPCAAGYLLAGQLLGSGRKVLVVADPSAPRTVAPDILGAAVYFPGVFAEDIASFGLPVPELARAGKLVYVIGGKKINIDPDVPRQILALAKAFPWFDKEIMREVEYLESASQKLLPGLSKKYASVRGKRVLGKRISRRGPVSIRSASHTGLEKLAGPADGVALALGIPAYVALDVQGGGDAPRVRAAGFGLRYPHMSAVNLEKLHIEAEFKYLNDGGDSIDAEPGTELSVDFAGRAGGILQIDGQGIGFEKIHMSKDTGAAAVSVREQLAGSLHGLTSLSTELRWHPPAGYDASANLHGVIIKEMHRPPINDNLLFFSIKRDAEPGLDVNLAIAVERGETLSKQFRGKRRTYLVSKMGANFAEAFGVKAEAAGEAPAHVWPQIVFHGKHRFSFYDDSLGPGSTLEDQVRYPRWASMREIMGLKR